MKFEYGWFDDGPRSLGFIIMKNRIVFHLIWGFYVLALE
jgi:hypothetical protein